MNKILKIKKENKFEYQLLVNDLILFSVFGTNEKECVNQLKCWFISECIIIDNNVFCGRIFVCNSNQSWDLIQDLFLNIKES